MLPAIEGLIVLIENTADYAVRGDSLPVLYDDDLAAMAGSPEVEVQPFLRWERPDGRAVYPAFQFSLGALDTRVARVHERFARLFVSHGFEPPQMLLATWLLARQEVFGGGSALDMLRSGKSEAVEGLVQDWVSSLLSQVPAAAQPMV